MTIATDVTGNDLDHLLSLPACTLITTGRTGTDFLQSLLDCHPEVLTFNGYLQYHFFWETSRCVAAGSYATADLIDEFIGKHIQIFKSRYDLIEKKHQLGEGFDESINIDLDQFRSVANKLLEGREPTSINTLLAIYGAYATCLGQDLSSKRLFFHHIHSFSALPSYLEDFPDSKIICMTRDPRANFVSGIENHRTRNVFWDTDDGVHLLFYINRILHDATPLEKLGNEYLVIKVEQLDIRPILEKLCSWLGISYHDSMGQSTWAGLTWHGDALSDPSKQVGTDRAILRNSWESRLSFLDKYVLNYIMYNRLNHYGYQCRQINFLDTLVIPFVILLPLSYELRFFSPRYLIDHFQRKELKTIGKNVLAYVKRVSLFMRFYLRVTRRKPFAQPLLTDD